MVNQLSALADETTTLTHPIRAPSKSPPPRQIPWGYGRDRVTAIAIDPIQLFVYWELKDESIDAARTQLGPSGARAALTLRIYDTSGRIFDGTNAHSHFDQEVQRNDRHWFCSVSKPNSAAHIEIGLRSPDGRFARIMRSGRVDFPRAEPAQPHAAEWMRVVASTGDVASRETAAAGGAPRPAASGSAEAPAESRQGGSEAVLGSEATLLDGSFESHVLEGYELRQVDYERYETDTGWQTDPIDPALFHRVITTSWQEIGFGIMSWESGPTESSWEAGPFNYPTEVIVPAAERFEGPTQVYRVGEQVRVLHGPWQVVIRGIQAHSSRRVLARWEVHRTWVSMRRPDRGPARSARGSRASSPARASARPCRRASSACAAPPRSSSSARANGASGAPARRASWRRASGSRAARASDACVGASEWRLMGASERRLMGASERRLMGASEKRMTGASEKRAGGASERRLAASERSPVEAPRTADAKGLSMAHGYFSLVLHAHLPFVRHPEDPTVMEEQWLYEAITGTYLPLLQMFEGLVARPHPVPLHGVAVGAADHDADRRPAQAALRRAPRQADRAGRKGDRSHQAPSRTTSGWRTCTTTASSRCATPGAATTATWCARSASCRTPGASR